MKRSLIILLSVLFGVSFSSGQEIRFSREKTLKLLHNLDSLIQQYEDRSSKRFENADPNAFRNDLLLLFENPAVPVFDDINPNLEEKQEIWINEKEKSIYRYLLDTDSTYGSLKCNISWTNLGDASGRIFLRDKRLMVPVSIQKDYSGYTQGEYVAGYATRSELKLFIRILDTVNFPLAISSITKTSPTSTEWSYTPPAIPQAGIETIFTLNTSAAWFYIDQYAPNSYAIDENLFNSYGFGGSGQLLFRFVFGRKPYRSWGMETGIGAGAYNIFYKQPFYTCVDERNDRDGDYYLQISEVEDVDESWLLYSFDVPLYLSFERWRQKKPNSGRYFTLGGKFSWFQDVSFTSDLTQSQYGYYPRYDVVLYDIPEYNFVSGKDREIQDTYTINPYNVAAEMALGKLFRNKSKSRICYFGLSATTYLLSTAPQEADDPLFGSGNEYSSMLSKISNGYPVYLGFTFGFKWAGRKDLLLRPKRVHYLEKFE